LEAEERENKRKEKWMLEPHLSVEVIMRHSIAKFSPRRFQQYQEMLPLKLGESHSFFSL